MYRNHLKSIPVLNASEADETVKKLLSLSEHWICPYNDYFFTVGAVSSRELFDSNGPIPPDKHKAYHEYRSHINPILISTFPDVYERVRLGLENALEKKVVYASDDIGIPGFQILGPNQQQKLMPQDLIDKLEAAEGWSGFHVDTPYLPHDFFWKNFDSKNFNNCLTFTLALQLPEAGSGLDVWNNIGDTEAAIEFNANYGIKTMTPIVDYDFVPYQTGNLTFFSGHVVHRVAGRHKLKPEDRRITLQGHGIECDNVWYLYY
jgi:hypothetical protein